MEQKTVEQILRQAMEEVLEKHKVRIDNLTVSWIDITNSRSKVFRISDLEIHATL